MELVVPPAGIVVDVDELADDLHIDHDELMALTRMVDAATDVVETATNRPILSRDVRIALPEGRFREFWLPCAPAIELLGADGAELLNAHEEPRVQLGSFEGDSIVARVGYANPNLAPRQLREAVILLVLEWREAKISVGEAYNPPALSFGVHRLLRQVRYRRPRVIC